jgi:integrase
MASISVDQKTGLKRLQFNLGEKRVTVHLGKPYARKPEEHSKKDRRLEAQAHRVFCAHIDALITASEKQDQLPKDTAAWLKDQDKGLLDKLGALGLTQERRRGPVALGAFIKDYLTKRTDIKPRSKICLEQTQRKLVGFFGADQDMTTITAGQIEDFRQYLVKDGLAENTINRNMGRAGQFFSKAFRDGLITKNPYDSAKIPSCRVRGNNERFHFVSREETQKLIDAAPDAEWRLLIALARYGGLRTPSEPLALTWDCINWESNRIRVPSPKTEHHAGKAFRWIPLFPELRPYLQQAFDEAKPGAQWVITRYRDKYTNVGTQIHRIANRAGVDLWEKPWQNMRATRQTELAETFPGHVVARWQGNSQAVAAEHYLMLTDEHFERAAGAAQNTAQKAAQYKPETVRNGSKPSDTAKSEIAVSSRIYEGLRNTGYPDNRYPIVPRGFEPLSPG